MKRSLNEQSLRLMLRTGLAVGLVLLHLAIAPFAVAQDVHHELAAADTDGHEHSDNDLCQWMQHHTSGSLVVAIPLVASWTGTSDNDLCQWVQHHTSSSLTIAISPVTSWAANGGHVWFPIIVLVSSSYLSVSSSRAPPRS